MAGWNHDIIGLEDALMVLIDVKCPVEMPEREILALPGQFGDEPGRQEGTVFRAAPGWGLDIFLFGIFEAGEAVQVTVLDHVNNRPRAATIHVVVLFDNFTRYVE